MSASLAGKYSVNRYLAGRDYSRLSYADKSELLHKILINKIHGISYSPYIDGQRPGDQISDEQIKQRLNIICPYTKWIRTFSCIDGNENAPRIAKDNNLSTMVGISLGEDKDANEKELINAIEIAKKGYVDILAVGNEVLLREDLTKNELLDYINRARQAVPNVNVGYVDAYFQFEENPELVDVSDVVLVNCYPYWENCPVEYSLLYLKDMYRRTERVANGKKVIISETGWPSMGSVSDATVPSLENAMQYFINVYTWAEEEGVEIFYFSSFDESWKIGDEGDVGAYWGLWDKEGRLKY